MSCTVGSVGGGLGHFIIIIIFSNIIYTLLQHGRGDNIIIYFIVMLM